MIAATMCAPSLALRTTPSPTASKEGNKRLQTWVESANAARDYPLKEAPLFPALETQLSESLSRATSAVFEQTRYLGLECSRQVVRSLTELLSLDAWDDGDELLKVGSVRTMLKAIIALQKGCGDLTVTRTGHLVATWRTHGETLRVEAKADGRMAWAVLHTRGSQPRHEHQADGSITDLQAAFAAS